LKNRKEMTMTTEESIKKLSATLGIPIRLIREGDPELKEIYIHPVPAWMKSATDTAQDYHSDLNLFHSIEHSILCEYLKRPDLLPEDAKGINPRKNVNPKSWNEAVWGIGPHSSHYETYKIENAVARICLSNVQNELPQWFCSKGNGEMIFGRAITEPVKRRVGKIHPQLLFMLNWANSGPGFSWPERYYVTHLPYYKVNFVTVSSDSTDSYGYSDVAIGFGSHIVPIKKTVQKAITRFWAATAPDNPKGFENFLFEGEVNEVLARRWLRNAVARRKRVERRLKQETAKDETK
jgi:hypothetical protein